MNLYLIDCKTEDRKYATNAETKQQAIAKFISERGLQDFKVEEVPVESLVRMEDNDDIIFF